MTEAEAKKKWCPMVRSVAMNQWNDSCVASDCMWWVKDHKIMNDDGKTWSWGGHCGAVK